MDSSSLLAIIDGREKGQFPISIATSLALEGAAGIYPERPESPAPIMKYREIWFNVRTVIRNLIEAIPTDYREDLTVDTLIHALIEDMTIIESAVVRASTGMARSVFYLTNYAHMARKFPKAILRIPSTPKQMLHKALEDGLLQRLAQQGVSVDYRVYSQLFIEGNHAESLIVTHLPVDLLARYQFKKLDLLESHTGIIKSYPQWNTKLTGGNDLPHIPFCQLSLQLFGDKGNHFSSMSAKLKKQVLEVAAQDNWSSVTTKERMALSFRRITDSTDRATLQVLL